MGASDGPWAWVRKEAQGSDGLGLGRDQLDRREVGTDPFRVSREQRKALNGSVSPHAEVGERRTLEPPTFSELEEWLSGKKKRFPGERDHLEAASRIAFSKSSMRSKPMETSE